MTIGAILTLGLGTFSDVNHLVTLGYGTGATPPKPVVVSTPPGGTSKKRKRKAIKFSDIESREAYEATLAPPPEPNLVLVEPDDDEDDMLLMALSRILH